VAELVFWLAILFVGYTYAGYPVCIWLMSRGRPSPTPDRPEIDDWPAVTVVIAVHNEQSRVAGKIENLRQLDYPQERLRILFVSDGSTDATNEILAKTPGIAWYAYPARRGKAYALNAAIPQVSTDIVVFCDVRQEIEAGAFKHLVGALMQPGVGAVSGELVHRTPRSQVAANIGLYWRYEKWIRKSESRFSSSIGATGALYAIYRKDYVPLADDALLDDFEIPMQIVRRGLRNVLEGRAIFFDETQSDTAGERKRKVRTLTGNYQAFRRNPWLFSPSQNPVFFQFVSHKVFRLVVPYALLLALLASAIAGGMVYSAAALLQTAFYLVALAGSLVAGLRQNKAISFAAVFLELNTAAVVALFKYVSGRVDARWEKT
jgi:cellulose synthase/poly-beta-1,6-N-acetylglucosamine synthase-like glycosyltransferase